MLGGGGVSSDIFRKFLFRVSSWVVKTTRWVKLFFGDFPSSKTPDAGVAPCPNMGAENLNFLKFPKTMVVEALRFRLGLLSIRILCFLKSDKK